MYKVALYARRIEDEGVKILSIHPYLITEKV